MLLGLGKDGPLAPNTEYFYVIGDSADAQSGALSFTTPPLTGPESLPYRRALGGMPKEYVALCTGGGSIYLQENGDLGTERGLVRNTAYLCPPQ